MSFPVSEKIDAFTNKTTAQVEKWLGSGDQEFVLVDTPGLCVCVSVCLSSYLFVFILSVEILKSQYNFFRNT